MAYLLTGRYFFLDEMKFRSGHTFLWNNWPYRGGSPGVFCRWGRERAWTIRQLAQCLALMPANDAASFRRWLIDVFDASSAFHINNYYAPGAPYRHPLGIPPGMFSVNAVRPLNFANDGDNLWFAEYEAFALGYASQLDLPLGNVTRFNQWRNYVFEGLLGAFGATGTGGATCWSRGWHTHHISIGPNDGPWPEAGYTTWQKVFEETWNTTQSSVCPLMIHANNDAVPASQEMFSTYYPGYAVPALAMARDLGIHTDYWTRWANAPNWISAQAWLVSHPLWAVVPRN
jgi:hypothetical protein